MSRIVVLTIQSQVENTIKYILYHTYSIFNIYVIFYKLKYLMQNQLGLWYIVTYIINQVFQ